MRWILVIFEAPAAGGGCGGLALLAILLLAFLFPGGLSAVFKICEVGLVIGALALIIAGVAYLLRSDGGSGSSSYSSTRPVERKMYQSPRELRLREGTSESTSPVVYQVPAGASVEIFDGPIFWERKKWWRVKYEGKRGWTSDFGPNFSPK